MSNISSVKTYHRSYIKTKEWLEKNPGRFDIRKIADDLGYAPGTIRQTLTYMERNGFPLKLHSGSGRYEPGMVVANAPAAPVSSGNSGQTEMLESISSQIGRLVTAVEKIALLGIKLQ